MDGAVCDEGRCVACADNDDCDGQICATVSGSRVCAECDPEAALGETGVPKSGRNAAALAFAFSDTNDTVPATSPCDGNICRPVVSMLSALITTGFVRAADAVL